MKKMMSSDELLEQLSTSSLIVPSFNFPLIVFGSCNICGLLDRLRKNCPKKHWTIKQLCDFYALKDDSNSHNKHVGDSCSQKNDFDFHEKMNAF